MVYLNLIFVSVDEIPKYHILIVMRVTFHLKIELSRQNHFPITIDELDMQAVIGTKKLF